MIYSKATPFKESLEEFYNSIKDKYPKYTREQIIEVTLFPWEYVREFMKEKNGIAPDFKLVNFGKFSIPRQKIEYKIRFLKELGDHEEDVAELERILVNFNKEEVLDGRGKNNSLKKRKEPKEKK